MNNTHFAERPASSLPFWKARLNAGDRPTGIGGSDNHDAGDPAAEASSVGAPTTVVHAGELSQAAVLEAIRRGHVFTDVAGGRDTLLEVEATSGVTRVEMGDLLPARAGALVAIQVQLAGAPAGARLSLTGDGAALVALSDPALGAADARRRFSFVADGRTGCGSMCAPPMAACC